jgi:hypothetical protein
MPFAIRLRLDPLFDERDELPTKKVVGLEPSFTLRGPPPSNAIRGTRVPGKLEFVGRLASSVRDHPTPEEKALGALSGQVTLLRDPPRVEFQCDADSLTTLTREPEQAPPEQAEASEVEFSPRTLRLRLGNAFSGLDALKGDVPRLFLPKGAGQFHYLEVFVRLTLSGVIEAELEQSDVLDVLIEPVAELPYPFSI